MLVNSLGGEWKGAYIYISIYICLAGCLVSTKKNYIKKYKYLIQMSIYHIALANMTTAQIFLLIMKIKMRGEKKKKKKNQPLYNKVYFWYGYENKFLLDFLVKNKEIKNLIIIK